MQSTVNGRVHTHHWLRLPGRKGVTVSAVTHARVLPGACGRGGVTGLRGCGQYSGTGGCKESKGFSFFWGGLTG